MHVVQVRACVRAGLMRRTSLQNEGAWLLSVDKPEDITRCFFVFLLGLLCGCAVLCRVYLCAVQINQDLLRLLRIVLPGSVGRTVTHCRSAIQFLLILK